MTCTWVALLRGINVGRAKRISMADLRVALEGLGYSDVRTHGQSGNVVFASDQSTAEALEPEISLRINHEFSMDVVVMLRSGADFAATVEANPFVTRGVAVSELHVAFLAQPAPAARIVGIDRDSCTPDEFAVGKRAIYLRLPNGLTGSRLPDLERTLGVRVTQRNWKTTTRLRDLVR